MSEELMITKEDLVNWLDRPPSNDDLDLIGFITTRLENFYKLEQENKQLKGILQEIYERAINTNITSLDFRDYILKMLGNEEIEEIPQFKGTIEKLNNLTILGGKDE